MRTSAPLRRASRLAMVVLAGLAASSPVLGQERLGWDDPSYEEMVVDGLLVRPVGFVSTVVGTAAWVVTLPFSALGGNAREAANELIGRPARFTFTRPLGDF